MNHLLVIDIGNTRTKWGWHDGRAWQEQGFLETAQLSKLYEQIINSKLFNIINKIYISSVADKGLTTALMQQLRLTGAEIKLVKPQAQQCGVINHYDTPELLGSDRWCALIGARRLHQGPAIVVMAGTAMTVDVLTAEGHFLGGIIVPGVSLMQDSLSKGTANLRALTGAFTPFPTRTQDAIHSGIISASLGAIEQMRRRLKAAGYENIVCFISGGAAALLAPYLGEPKIQVDNLVLEGLLHIANAESVEHK